MTSPAPATSPVSPQNANEQPWPVADERWERAASAEHLLILLLDEPDVRAVLEGCAVDASAVRAPLDRLIASSVPARGDSATPLWRLGAIFRIGGRSSPVPAPIPDAARIVERARINARASNGRPVGAIDVFVSLLKEPPSGEAVKLLWQAGLTQYDALRFISHGLEKGQVDRHLAEDEARDGSCDVVMLNDNFTPMDLVVEILERFFGKSNDDARRIMLAIHSDGSAVVGTYHDRKSALAKAEQVTTFVRGHQQPLRCVVAHSRSEREGSHAELLT